MNKHEQAHKKALNSKKRIPLTRIIRLKCLECCCFNESEVRNCSCKDCILFKFRMGKNPFPKKMSEKHKESLKKNLKKGRESKG